MSYPIAHIRYGLDATEGCWRKIASQIEQDISQHFLVDSNSSPFDANYLLDDVLYKKSYRVLRPGILALGYLTSVDLDSPQSFHDRYLLTHTYCDLLTMSLYPSTPIKAVPTSIDSDMTQEQIEEVLNGCAQRQKQRQKQMEQKALYFDQEHYANVIQQDQIPHNNILLRTMWLLCDILRVIRSIPLPLPHPSIQQLIHLSTHLWLIVQYSFMILLPFTINSPFLDIYPNIWDIHPQCPKLILDNITVPLKDGSSAFVIHLFERHLMLPLPFIRELFPYQAAFTKPGQEDKLQRNQAGNIPPCNKHSPNNFFLLLSQYSLLVPCGNEEPTKRLYSGLLDIQPPYSGTAYQYNKKFRENVLLSEFSNKTMRADIETYRNENSISDDTSLSDEQLALYIPMTSVSALSNANEIWQSQIPHLLSYPDPEEDEKSNGLDIFSFQSHTIKSDLSYSLSQLWSFIFQIVDEYASRDGESTAITFQFVHQFKLLSIIKDQIERTILSVYWDGEHHLLQLQSLMGNNDVNSPEVIQKECSIGFNLLSFLHPLAMNLIPQDVITNSNESNMSKLDNTSLQAIQHMLLRTQHRQVKLQDWLQGGTYPLQTTSIASPINSTLLINEIPVLQRNALTFELYSGREFRPNDLWRAIAWPLYAYWMLSRNLRKMNEEFTEGKDALARLNLQNEKESRDDMITLLQSDPTSKTNPRLTELLLLRFLAEEASNNVEEENSDPYADMDPELAALLRSLEDMDEETTDPTAGIDAELDELLRSLENIPNEQETPEPKNPDPYADMDPELAELLRSLDEPAEDQADFDDSHIDTTEKEESSQEESEVFEFPSIDTYDALPSHFQEEVQPIDISFPSLDTWGDNSSLSSLPAFPVLTPSSSKAERPSHSSIDTRQDEEDTQSSDNQAVYACSESHPLSLELDSDRDIENENDHYVDNDGEDGEDGDNGNDDEDVDNDHDDEDADNNNDHDNDHDNDNTNDNDNDNDNEDDINIGAFFTPYNDTGPYGISTDAKIPDELMLKWVLPTQIHFLYFDQFIQDAIYQINLLMLIYKINDASFGSSDMKLFSDSYSSSFHEMVDEILTHCLFPGGWIANNTLFSMLFINPSSLITSLPLADTVLDGDRNGAQEEPQFDEDNVLCSKSLELRTFFDPFTAVPFHNRAVLNLDKIFRRTDELATRYPNHDQQIMNILDNNTVDLTPINFHAPLLDFIVDAQLNSVQVMFGRRLLDQKSAGLKLHDSFHYKPRRVYCSFFHALFFHSWDPMVLLVDIRIKQLYQWIFTHKKQYVQLYEQHALIFQSQDTWLQKYPFISEYCLQICETLYFEHVYAASLPINRGDRIPLQYTDDVSLYKHKSMNVYQFGKPLRKEDLPHKFIPCIKSQLESHRLIYRDHHDNGLDLPSIFDTTSNSGSDPSLTSSITSILTDPHLYSTAFTIETPHELTQVYKNQLEYLNFWYFNSNILPMYLFRIERQYWILQLAALKYRFARHCIAFSVQTGLTLNRDFFEQYLKDDEEYKNPFFVPPQDISLIPESHREFYDTLSIDIDNPDNYKHSWAPHLYHFQHFLSLFYTVFEPSNATKSTVISLLHPTIEALKECKATEGLVDKATPSELTIHPLLSDMWQSFSYATEYQHYIGSKMLYHRSWVTDYEAMSEEIFTTKYNPIFTYFKYIVHMLYFSLDIENNLPLLQHFLFTVNYYSLNRRFIMMSFLTMITWNSSDSIYFVIVILLDHIYRLALDRCIQVDSYHQKLAQIPTSFECPFPPHLYSRDYIAPIIHQQVELLSCAILGAAGIALSRPYEENFSALTEALYPTYPTQLERGWHNGDPNPVQLPRNDPDEPENDDVKDREGFPVDDHLMQNDAFTSLIDPNSYEYIPSRRPPQFNVNIIDSVFYKIYFSKISTCGHIFPLPSSSTALNILFDSAHPFLRIIFGLLRNKQGSGKFDTEQHSKSWGSILTPHYIHDYIEASGKTTGNILSFSADHLIQVPGYSNQTKSCIELLTDKKNVTKSTSSQTSCVAISSRRQRYHNPLDDCQSMSTEQSSFNIQYCIESFIDLMLVCDNTRPVSSVVLESQPEGESNDTPIKFDFAYLSQIFDSLDFTSQMDVSTNIGSDEDINGLPEGFIEQNGPGFVSPFSASSSSSLTTTTYLNDTPIQIPMAPHCGMLLRKENLRPGFYQHQVFNTPLFQTFLKNPTTDDLILNPILTSIIDYQPIQQHFPKFNQETEAMMTHNLSLHVNEYRRRLYGADSVGFSTGTD